jgi:hypothetical protein
MFKRYITVSASVALLQGLVLCPLSEAQMNLVTERPDRLFAFDSEAAAKGLEDVKRLRPDSSKSQQKIDEDDAYAKALGFDSAQQAGSAQLGGSLYIYMSRLEWFKNAPIDFRELLRGTSSYIYTLKFNGEAKSSITVAKDRQTERWHPVEWGSRKLIRLLERQRIRHPGISFVVLVSPQNPWGLRFVGEERAGQFFLTPLADINEIGLREGLEVPAAILTDKLRGLADQQPKPRR